MYKALLSSYLIVKREGLLYMEEKNSDIKIPKVTRTIQCVNSTDNTIMRNLVQTVSFYPTIIYDANDGELISVNYPDYKNFEK